MFKAGSALNRSFGTPFHFALRAGSNFSHIHPLNWLVCFSLFLSGLFLSRIGWNMAFFLADIQKTDFVKLSISWALKPLTSAQTYFKKKYYVQNLSTWMHSIVIKTFRYHRDWIFQASKDLLEIQSLKLKGKTWILSTFQRLECLTVSCNLYN